jgi:hypothetical protein
LQPQLARCFRFTTFGSSTLRSERAMAVRRAVFRVLIWGAETRREQSAPQSGHSVAAALAAITPQARNGPQSPQTKS